MSGVGITGLIANLPGTVTPYPTQDPALEFGGYRSVANAAARDAIPANFRSIGMATTLQDTGIEYKLLGGITNADWVATSDAGAAYVIRANLAALTALDDGRLPNGCQAYVVAEQEIYQLDTANALTTFSPLIVARGSGAGKWYRRSRAYVVARYTLWCEAYSVGAVGFTPGQLQATATVTPDIQLTFGALPTNGQQDLVIDALGNIWITFNDGTFTAITIRKFLAKDCLASGSPTKALEISVPVPPATSESGCSLFDRSGGLWTNNGTHGANGVASFLRYGAKAYEQDTAQADTTLVAGPSPANPSTSNVQYMVLDGAGNLWASLVGGNGGAFNGAIVMYTAAQLQAGGSGILPTVYWTGANFTGVALGATTGLALASNGFLWCADYPDNRLRAWNTIGAASGDPVPDVVLTSASFAGPYTVAFDAAGNLWTQNAFDNRLLRIAKANLGASGVVVPDVIITSTVALGNIAFPNNPDKSGLLPSGFP